MTISTSHQLTRSSVSERDGRRKIGGMVQGLITSSRAALLFIMMQVTLACNPQGLPPLIDDHRSRDSSDELVDFLVPSYQFSCHGLVANWSACVDPGGDKERYNIEFQVWRSSADGCFTLAGINVPSQLLVPVDHCVEYLVPSNEQIEVFPGDIIGFYVDRFKLSRRGDELEDPDNGGVQLDTQWDGAIRLLSPGDDNYLTEGVGTRLCPTQLQQSLGAAPVLSAGVVPLPPPTSSIVSPSSSSTPSPSPLSPSPSPHLTLDDTNYPSPSPSPSRAPLPHPPPSPSPSPSPAPLAASQMDPSSTPLPEHSSHTLVSPETVPSPMTSSIMTSSPIQPGVIPIERGGIPPLLIGGIFMACILIIAITSLAVVLVTMLLWKPRSVKGKVDCEDVGEMVYSEAYESNGSVGNSSNTDSLPQVLGLVWNRAYNKCSMLEECGETEPEPEHGNGTRTAECGPGAHPEVREEPHGEKEVIYEEVSERVVQNRPCPEGHNLITCNEYEEIY